MCSHRSALEAVTEALAVVSAAVMVMAASLLSTPSPCPPSTTRSTRSTCGGESFSYGVPIQSFYLMIAMMYTLVTPLSFHHAGKLAGKLCHTEYFHSRMICHLSPQLTAADVCGVHHKFAF